MFFRAQHVGRKFDFMSGGRPSKRMTGGRNEEKKRTARTKRQSREAAENAGEFLFEEFLSKKDEKKIFVPASTWHTR